MRILIGDIGGTNTRVSLLEVDEGHRADALLLDRRRAPKHATDTLATGRNEGSESPSLREAGHIGPREENAGDESARAVGHAGDEDPSFPAWVKLLAHGTFFSANFHGLAPILHVFLGAENHNIAYATFGVAGPVVDNTCRATNLPWKVDGDLVASELGIPRLVLINDFYAIALGIDMLAEDDVEVLCDRPVDEEGPMCILGAGTGLGEVIAFRRPRGNAHHASGERDAKGTPAQGIHDIVVLPSEGGHTDFAPRDEREIELLRFLLGRHARVSYERVLSGPGLVTLFEFVTTKNLAAASDELRVQLRGGDAAAVIGQAAVAGSDPACVLAGQMFASLYGAEAGNLALKVLPTGGLYVAGGIAPKMAPLLRENNRFLASFTHKGRMSNLLEGMRVSIVHNTRVGLLGALRYAVEACMPNE